MNLPLVTKKAEARVDSRLLAQQLDNEHKATVQLIEKYGERIKSFGLLPVEMEAVKRAGARGTKHHRYYLLNENQSLFILSLSRNTERVVDLKARLIQAFSEARRAAELHAEYLPTYHGLHDQLHTLAAGSPNERWAHANLNKLVNKAAGIEAGQRPAAGVPQKAMLIAAQHIATQAMQGAADHHEAHARVKAALAPLMPQKLIGR